MGDSYTFLGSHSKSLYSDFQNVCIVESVLRKTSRSRSSKMASELQNRDPEQDFYFVDSCGAIVRHEHMLECWELGRVFYARFVEFATLRPYQDGVWAFASEQELLNFCFVFGFTKRWVLEQ